MEIIIEPDAGALADRAAQIVFGELARNPRLVLGLATGKTPIGLYQRLRTKPEAFQHVHGGILARGYPPWACRRSVHAGTGGGSSSSSGLSRRC